jgi:pyruvate-formate lyase-activating enzyme
VFSLFVSDKKGRIFDIPGIEAAGMKAGCFFRLNREDFIKMPEASSLFMLPGRSPVGYNGLTSEFEALEGYFAVAAFIAPAFTGTYNSAFKEINNPNILPLFCYTAAAYYKGGIYAAAIRIDRSSRHDPKCIDMDSVAENAKKIKKLLPANRLVRHLADCALVHGCPGAQNFFLSRQECPLPASNSCNASCAGCISYQKSKNIIATQPRIKFTPYPEELAEIALFHSRNVKNSVLSFGQGCEGEPLLQADLLERSIRLIRNRTKTATININTNASKPKAIALLFDSGLNSIRVSMNSAREKYYNRYYRPSGYTFKDVLSSIRIAKKKKGFVSINYLTMPGFTDSKAEYAALKKFIEAYKIDMIQWRNMNFDPLAYFKIIKCSVRPGDMIGVKQMIQSLQRSFPCLKMGYYNPHI